MTGACANRMLHVPEMEAALSKSFLREALKDVRVGASGLSSDIHADADYRAHLVGVMARRAVQVSLQ